MAIVVFQHHPLESPGRLGHILGEHGQKLDICRVHDDDPMPVDLDGVDGLLLMGGPPNTSGLAELPWMQREVELVKEAHALGLPVVGICLGAQIIAVALGGEVEPMDAPEAGFSTVSSSFFGSTDPILAGIPWHTPQFHLHGNQITKTPPGGTPIPLQSSKACKVQSFRVGMTTYGFQYHFEFTRGQLVDCLDANAEFLSGGGVDVAGIKGDIDAHFNLHRHLGDRLCRNLTTLLYPVDKRLPPVGADVTNFRA